MDERKGRERRSTSPSASAEAVKESEGKERMKKSGRENESEVYPSPSRYGSHNNQARYVIIFP